MTLATTPSWGAADPAEPSGRRPHVVSSPSIRRTGTRTLPGVRRPGSGASRTIRLPYALYAVPLARRTVVADLEARSVPSDIVDEAETVVAELVSNALRHARSLSDGTLRVHWQARESVVELEVTDGGGPTRPRPAQVSGLALAGRGLRIVRSLAHEWGVLDTSIGQTVWVSLGGPSRRRRH